MSYIYDFAIYMRFCRGLNKKIEHDMEQLAGKLDKFKVAMGINSK